MPTNIERPLDGRLPTVLGVRRDPPAVAQVTEGIHWLAPAFVEPLFVAAEPTEKKELLYRWGELTDGASDNESEVMSVHDPATERASEIYSTLADAERRAVVTYLATNGGTATVSDLVRELPDQPPPEDGVDAERLRRLRLLHRHLPKMDGADVLEYDRDGRRVTLTRTGRAVETTMHQLEETLRDLG